MIKRSAKSCNQSVAEPEPEPKSPGFWPHIHYTSLLPKKSAQFNNFHHKQKAQKYKCVTTPAFKKLGDFVERKYTKKPREYKQHY